MKTALAFLAVAICAATVSLPVSAAPTSAPPDGEYVGHTNLGKRVLLVIAHDPHGKQYLVAVSVGSIGFRAHSEIHDGRIHFHHTNPVTLTGPRGELELFAHWQGHEFVGTVTENHHTYEFRASHRQG